MNKASFSEEVEFGFVSFQDFLMGECLRKRGGKCRFRHLTKAEYKHEVYGSRMGPEGDPQHAFEIPSPESGPMPPDPKRQRFEASPPQPPSDFCDRDFVRAAEDLLPREMALRDYRELDRRGLEEMLLLRKQLETLKKEVAVLKKENSDLRATNDFLLEKVSCVCFLEGNVASRCFAWSSGRLWDSKFGLAHRHHEKKGMNTLSTLIQVPRSSPSVGTGGC